MFIYGNRMVAEKNAEKKHKIQKVKPKAATAAAAATSTVEAKKHLAGVRVIQRNLVYIIGLPAHLCNESVSTISLFSTRYIQVTRHV
jgi:CCR4-NOT transcription complex subunit 4